jgi:uncharacterized membrane protein YjgN (DUF898 family)
MNFQSQSPVRYHGGRGEIFALAFMTSLLTVVTLGIYRFWAKTRVRKYIWSSVNLGGDRLEYTGTGLEKFLGFLIAIVVLAVYLGIVQLLLFFAGLHFVVEPQSTEQALMQIGVIYITLLALVPLILFAQYRARRYMMARTRLRGIRFGMENAAWGYVWRAILHYLLTAVTLGIFLPRQTFWLEKYKTDRSYYGNARFEQGGKWTALYGAMVHVFIGLAMIIIGGVIAAAAQSNGALLISGIGYVWLLVGGVYYYVRSSAYLHSNKTLDGQVGFWSDPRTGTVIGIYIGGGLITGLVAGLLFGLAGGILARVVGGIAGAGGTGPLGIVVVVALYLFAFALIGALSMAFIVQPIIAHFCTTLTVRNAAALAEIRQRAHDPSVDADGFADALDIGGAI